MTQEEKAKAYDEALERAKSAIKDCGDNKGRIAMIESIFPALYQSEDERIRKRLIDFFEDWQENRSHCWGIAVTAILAWLEKQGSSSVKWQKNTPDNKPAINHSVLMKTTHGVAEGYYVGSLWFQFRWSSNIKDSDVLAWMELSDLDEQSEQKPVDKVEPFDKYEGLTDFERTLADICIGWIGEELGWKQYIKDSADVLLKIAIKKFNSIQDAPFEQKSAAWSDEDEKMANDLIEGFQSQVKVYNLVHTSKEITDWLKSVKDRMVKED